jgi:hypothetical protein
MGSFRQFELRSTSVNFGKRWSNFVNRNRAFGGVMSALVKCGKPSLTCVNFGQRFPHESPRMAMRGLLVSVVKERRRNCMPPQLTPARCAQIITGAQRPSFLI